MQNTRNEKTVETVIDGDNNDGVLTGFDNVSLQNVTSTDFFFSGSSEEKSIGNTYRTIFAYAALTSIVMETVTMERKRSESNTVQNSPPSSYSDILSKYKDLIPKEMMKHISRHLYVYEYMNTLNLLSNNVVPFNYDRIHNLYYHLVPEFKNIYYTVYDSSNNNMAYASSLTIPANINDSEFKILTGIPSFEAYYTRKRIALTELKIGFTGDDLSIANNNQKGLQIQYYGKNLTATVNFMLRLTNKDDINLLSQMEEKTLSKYNQYSDVKDTEDMFKAPNVDDEFFSKNFGRQNRSIFENSIGNLSTKKEDKDKLMRGIGTIRKVAKYLFERAGGYHREGLQDYNSVKARKNRREIAVQDAKDAKASLM